MILKKKTLARAVNFNAFTKTYNVIVVNTVLKIKQYVSKHKGYTLKAEPLVFMRNDTCSVL